MYKRNYNSLILVILIFLSLHCTRPHQNSEGAPQIVTSIFPVYDMAQNIAGERMKVVYLVPSGANPHTYEPTPSTVIKVKSARAFIGVSHHFDGWIEKFLPPEAKRYYLVDEKGLKNPHVWLSFKKVLPLCFDIAGILIKLDPEGEKVYHENLLAYENRIKDADKKIHALLGRFKGAAFIQWHPAWDYLAADYGLAVLATIESGHGDEPSIKEFKEIMLRAKKSNVSLIVTGINNQSKAVEALRKEIKGTVVLLDSIGGPDREGRSTYIDLMLYNAEKLSAALEIKRTGR